MGKLSITSTVALLTALVLTVAGSVQVADGSPFWSTAQLSQARAYLSATSAGNQVFFAGGLDSSGNTSNVVDIYNTSTGMWTTAALSQARSGPRDPSQVSRGRRATPSLCVHVGFPNFFREK